MLVLLFAARDFARADDYAFRMGPGIAPGLTGKVKLFSIRTEEDLIYGIRFAKEGGFWVDNRGAGNDGSVYGKLQLGVAPGNVQGVYGSAFIGPALISQSDASLGGHFQFSEDIGVGVRDETSFVHLGYVHFSSAGLSSPNRGRDFLIGSVGLRF